MNGRVNIFEKYILCDMIFSKSFGYALRGILYIALMQDERRNVQVEEIAARLNVPKHFLGKILKVLVKEGLLHSAKGPNGGFSVSSQTLQTPLYNLIEITDGISSFKTCVLRLQACSATQPCPLHYQMEGIIGNLKKMLLGTLVADLLQHDKEQFIQSIATKEFGLVLQNIKGYEGS
jgi:Rrf2 family transcriptional regulator, iron-sulfur cluster assembly transcription factor